MRVLALASYPSEAAATRYRLEQFIAPLAQRGITLSIHPFINSQLFKQLYNPDAWLRNFAALLKSGLLRPLELSAARKSDVVLIQREAMLFGPPIIEWLTTRVVNR
ncbi:MAG TPA: hypothetical protein VGU64_02890, partial [Terriglobales bacterium]|nr:hypothetical protein [Terriglobales bacterium]